LKKSKTFNEVVYSRRMEEAKSVREGLFQRARAAVDQMGDDLAGFALVVWDRHGDMRTSYDTRIGPIRDALVPTLAADALNRHVAVMLATQEKSET
jgi:hypothetical protein